MFKNLAGQHIPFFMRDTDGVGVEGLVYGGMSPTLSIWITGDDEIQGAGAGTVTEIGFGEYRYHPTEGETNNALVTLLAVSSTLITDPVFVYTVPQVQAANLTHINGNPNAQATLYLEALSVINPNGTAINAISQGGNGRGINAEGNGTGSGIRGKGGATANGISGMAGDTSGTGIKGTGIHGPGIWGEGADNNAGVYGTGGTGGNGAEFVSGTNAGNGLVARAIGVITGGYGARFSGSLGVVGISSSSWAELVTALALGVWEYGARTLTALGFDTQNITVVNPARIGKILDLVIGDDYLATDGRALTWKTETSTTWPTLTDATVKLTLERLRPYTTGDTSVEWEVDVITGTGDEKEVSTDVLNTYLETAAAGLASYKYRLWAVLSTGSKVTLSTGTVNTYDPANHTAP